MRFLLAIYKYNPFGGLQRDTLRLIRELAGRGHETTVFTTAWDGPPPPEGTTVETVPVSAFRSNHARMTQFADAFRRRLTKKDFDVSVAMSRIPGADFYFAADVCMKVYWSNLHSAFALRFNPRYAAYLRLERAVLAPPSATRIACIAPAQMRDYAAAYGTEPERMFLLPPGMDPACRRPADAGDIRKAMRGKLGAAPDDTVILLVSNSVYNKGTDRAIAAAGALPEDRKKTIRLWIVGKLPERELRAMLFLHPARNESAGSALIESLAAGTPVVTTEICGFAHFVQEANGTVLSGPFEQDALVRMLEGLLPVPDGLRRRTLAYAEQQDFCSRAKAFADILEKG